MSQDWHIETLENKVNHTGILHEKCSPFRTTQVCVHHPANTEIETYHFVQYMKVHGKKYIKKQSRELCIAYWMNITRPLAPLFLKLLRLVKATEQLTRRMLMSHNSRCSQG